MLYNYRLIWGDVSERERCCIQAWGCSFEKVGYWDHKQFFVFIYGRGTYCTYCLVLMQFDLFKKNAPIHA